MLAVLLSVVLSFQDAAGQTDAPEKTFGDREVEGMIQTQTREIYGKETAKVFLMTSDDVLGLGGSRGTELEGSLVGPDLVRVVATAFTKRGKYGAEYYMRDGKLLFVYETFEYFAKNAPAGAWQNFRHIAAWERRSYFWNGVIAYGSSRGEGAPEPGNNAKKLHDQGRHVAALLAGRPQVPVPQRNK